MNTNPNSIVEFLEKNLTEEEEAISLEEMIATLEMDSAECWF